MTDRADRGAPKLAWRSATAWGAFLAMVCVLLAADLYSKNLAFARIAGEQVVIDRAEVMDATALDTLIPSHEPITVAPELLDLTLVLNPGAVFGIGAGKRWFFVAFTLGALAFAIWVFARWTTARSFWTHGALAMLIAGGLGNLHDRVIFACVRDFLHPLPGVKLPMGARWPNGSDEVWPYVSNIADLQLIIGIVALMALTWKSSPTDSGEQQEDASKADDQP